LAVNGIAPVKVRSTCAEPAVGLVVPAAVAAGVGADPLELALGALEVGGVGVLAEGVPVAEPVDAGVGNAGAAVEQAARATPSAAITRTWTGADRGM